MHAPVVTSLWPFAALPAANRLSSNLRFAGNGVCGTAYDGIFSLGYATKPAWTTCVFTALGAAGTPEPAMFEAGLAGVRAGDVEATAPAGDAAADGATGCALPTAGCS